MRVPPCFAPACLLLCLASRFLTAESNPKPKNSTTVIAVTLPDASSGIPYNKRIVGALGLATGDYHCADATPELPDGLAINCKSDIRISGKPSATTDIPVRSKLAVTDVLGHTVSLELSFTVRPVDDTVVVGGDPHAVPPTVVKPTDPPIDFANLRFRQTIPVAEGISTAAGLLTPPLGKSATKYSLRAWIASFGQEEALAVLKPPAKIPLTAESTYSVTFEEPLRAGQSIRFDLLDASGEELTHSPTFSIPKEIELAEVGLEVTSELKAGTSIIAGKVNMPANLNPPDMAKKPISFGNFPQIVVWVKDADLDQWSQAPLSIPEATGTQNFKPVSTDGSFSVTLKTPLKASQEVRVDAIPPVGRTFSAGPTPPPPPELAKRQGMTVWMSVRTANALVQPSLSTPLTEGVTVLTGVATAPDSGLTMSVAVLKVNPRVQPDLREGKPISIEAQVAEDNRQEHRILTKTDRSSTLNLPYRDPDLTAVCITADDLKQFDTDGKLMRIELSQRGRLLPLSSGGSNLLVAPVEKAGTFRLTLADPLKEDDLIQIVQVLPSGTNLAAPQYERCASPATRVRYGFDWHRTNLNFVAGVLINNSSTTAANANFSQASQFYALNLDRAWQLPGVNCVGASEPIMQIDGHGKPVRPSRSDYTGRAFGEPHSAPCRKDGWHADKLPGINTYFEGRLTSIPVSTPTANPTASQTATSTTPSSLLTSQKVFRVSAGIFLPWVLGHGEGHHTNGIFLAPLAKAGFDTVTGATPSSSVVLPDGSPGTLSYQHAYNFFAFGGRLGNMELSASHDRAPKIDHYLDVTIGRYSNLESFVCHQAQAGQTVPTALPGSSCGDYVLSFPAVYNNVIESRKQLFRLDFEGLVKIPIPATAIPVYIGFNANISQHTVGAEALDHSYAPPDDIRILFATKIDMGALLSTFKLDPTK